MRAGRQRTLITIQTRTDTPDGMGGNTVAWSTFGTVYGHEIVKKAGAATLADQISSVFASKWETRFLAGITPKMRLIAGSRTFEIEAALDPSGKGERLEILCTELQNPGV